MQLRTYFNPVFIRQSLFVVLVPHYLVYYSSKYLLLLCHIMLFIKIDTNRYKYLLESCFYFSQNNRCSFRL